MGDFLEQRVSNKIIGEAMVEALWVFAEMLDISQPQKFCKEMMYPCG